MRIGLKDGDYTFYITEGQLDDLINKGSKLEETLLEQRFTLEPSANLRSTDGIDLSYNGSNLGNVEQIEIKVSLGVLERVRRGETAGTKYNRDNYLFICRDD
ncbi:hypothetical protein J4423_02205 [Candidatus Pacearchaeota archaeon]|nr:hypothetical protein [Candidatus Pacearchaeota archaeon]